MPQCQQCGTENKPHAMFCKGCGASLAGARETAPSSPAPPQEEVASRQVVGQAPRTEPAAPARPVEQVRGSTVPAGVLPTGAPPIPTEVAEPAPPARIAKPTLSPPVVAGLAAAVLVVVGGLWWWLSGATMRKFDAALSSGKLIGTDGISAFELYSEELRNKGTTSSRVQRMKERARPVVRRRVDDLFNRWYQDSDLGEGTRWSDVQKLGAWSAEMEPGDNEAQARAKFAQGQTELLANHFVEAEQLFRSALVHRAEWTLALNGIGRACRNQRNLQCTEEYYKRAALADPGWIFPHQNLAGLYLEQNRLAESETEYLAAVRLNPSRPGSRFLLGQLYDRKRSFPEACAEYRAALSLAASQTRVSFDRDWVTRRVQRICK